MNLTIVAGRQPSRVEAVAVSDLQGYLRGLFGIEARVADRPDPRADAYIVVGNPQTNPFAAPGWPDVTEQGIVIRRTDVERKTGLLVGGGSPAATLWAVSRLAELWGVRHLLHGDAYPESAGPFRLPDADLVCEPSMTVRTWRVVNDLAMGPECWGMDDYRPVLHQLAKMTFNRIFVSIYPWQPFLDLRIDGLRRAWSTLWYDFRYPITDDMPGRGLFGDEPELWNPDLPPRGTPYAEMAAAGERFIHELIACANGLGMGSGIICSILEFPKEFESLVPDAQPVHQLGRLDVVPGPSVPVDDPRLFNLSASVIRTTIDTYPEVDFYTPAIPEFVSWTDVYEEAWRRLDEKYDIEKVISLEGVLAEAAKHDVIYDFAAGGRAVTEAKGNIAALYFLDSLLSSREVLPRSVKADARFCVHFVEQLGPILPLVLPEGTEVLQNLAYTPSRALRRRDAIRRTPGRTLHTNMIFTLHDDNIGVLPQLCTGSLHGLRTAMRDAGWRGFCTRYWLTGDHDPCLAYLSRASWDPEATPEDAYRDLLGVLCGERAVEPILEALGELEAATIELEKHAMGLTFVVPKMGTKHFEAGKRPDEVASAQLRALREAYARAAAAIRRAPPPAGDAGREFVAYWLGRLQFGMEYVDFIELMRRAGGLAEQARVAEEAADGTTRCARIGESCDALASAEQTARRALDIYAGVARDRSDKGAIAAMAEYVVRDVARLREKLTTEI